MILIDPLTSVFARMKIDIRLELEYALYRNWRPKFFTIDYQAAMFYNTSVLFFPLLAQRQRITDTFPVFQRAPFTNPNNSQGAFAF